MRPLIIPIITTAMISILLTLLLSLLWQNQKQQTAVEQIAKAADYQRLNLCLADLSIQNQAFLIAIDLQATAEELTIEQVDAYYQQCIDQLPLLDQSEYLKQIKKWANAE